MNSRRTIQLLPEHLIDQIKAGEVIEKPSSLIKELIENSLDAKASQISLHLVDNGLSLIQLEDNGQGMDRDQLPLAFCRHATSKIHRFEDLYNLSSYGFRGEALASISAVSKLICTSAPVENLNQGGRIQFEGGKLISHTDHQADHAGTQFYIKDLFFNTPARLKFLKSATSERNSLKKMIETFLISAHNVQFSIKWDDKDKKVYSAKETIEERILQIYGQGNELEILNQTYEDYKITALISKKSSRSPSGKHQFLFVNQRHFFDKTLHQLIIRALEGFWPYGENGDYYIFLDVPTDQLDVNVHPHKTQVKFYKSSLVYSLISGSLKTLKPAQEQIRPELQLSHSPYLPSAENRDYRSVLDQREDRNDEDLLIPFARHFGFYQDQNQETYLVNLKHCLSHKLERELGQLDIQKDSDVSPLLISEPFKIPSGEIDKHIKPLLQMGIELDRLDGETLALRTIPLFLEKMQTRVFIGELCHFLVQSHAAKLSTRDLFYLFIKNHLPADQIQNTQILEVLKEWMRENKLDLLEEKIMIQLDEAQLKRFFP